MWSVCVTNASQADESPLVMNISIAKFQLKLSILFIQTMYVLVIPDSVHVLIEKNNCYQS